MMIFRNQHKNKKWEKRPQLYKGRFYYFRKLVQSFMILALLLGVFSIVMYFRNSDALIIKKIEILSLNTHILPQEIVALSQVTPKDKLFTINLSQVAKNIYRHPWVEHVQIRREFPNRLQIHVTEREPYLYVLAGDTYIADKNGVVFKKKEAHENYNLPVVSGLSKNLAVTYPQLTSYYFKNILGFYESLKQAEFYKNHTLEQIHFDLSQGMTVFADEHLLEIYYGNSDFTDKQDRLNQLGQKEKNLGQLFSRLDFSQKDRIIARKRL